MGGCCEGVKGATANFVRFHCPLVAPAGAKSPAWMQSLAKKFPPMGTTPHPSSFLIMQGGKTPRHKTQLRRHKFLNDFLKGRYIPMKKLISLFLALMLAILAIPALAEDAQDPDMAFDPDIDPDFLVGAWESWTGNPLEIPDDVKAAFEKAMEGLVGHTYEPIAILGSQVVSGMNYCLLCKTTVVTPDAPVSYTLVYIYEALDGTAEILRIQDVVFDAFPAENG